MKTKQFTILILAFSLATAGTPKIFNALKGELDYTKRELPVTSQILSERPTPMGKILRDGSIVFTLTKMSAKKRHEERNMLPAKLQTLFDMNECEGDDLFAKDPYEGSFAHRVNTLHLSLYDITVGTLLPVSDKDFLENNGFSAQKLTKGSQYYFFLLEKDVHLKKTCTQHPFYDDKSMVLTIHADMKLKKGWNFVEKRLETIQEYYNKERDYRKQTPKKIGFYLSELDDPKIKWYANALAQDEDIRLLDKLALLKPLDKEKMLKQVPNVLGSLVRTGEKYGATLPRSTNKQTLHLSYVDKNSSESMELYISDCAGDPEMLLMANQIYKMEEEHGETKVKTAYVAQKRRGSTQLIYTYGDRLVINARSKTYHAEKIWNLIRKIPFKRMLK